MRGGKAAWSLFLIFVPFLGVLIYLIARQRQARASPRPAAGGTEAIRYLCPAVLARRQVVLLSMQSGYSLGDGWAANLTSSRIRVGW